MARHPEVPEPAIDRRFAIVEAFADGERVDPDALKAALADADVRDHFVDLLMLREAIGGDPVVLEGALPRRPVRLRWWAAAAALTLCVGAGYAVGQRVVVPVDAAVVEIDLERQPPPEPTRTIVLKPGVNWTEDAGGQ